MQQFWNTEWVKKRYASIQTKGQAPDDSVEFYKSGAQDVDMIAPYIVSGMHVLDIGCGVGRMCRSLQKQGCAVTGVDVSSDMIERARAENPDCEFFSTSGEDLAPIKTNSMDFVFSYAALQHVPQLSFIRSYLSEVARVLKPGSTALLEFRGEPGNTPGKVLWFDSFNRFAIGIALWRGILPVPFLRIFNPMYGCALRDDRLNLYARRAGLRVKKISRQDRHLWLVCEK